MVHDTTPGGAKIAVAVPKNWNHKVLLLAHGHRPEGTGLIDNLEVESYFLSELLQSGWIVGMSSYRRDGIIVRDAIEDMNELREYIVKNVGTPLLTLLEGRSMGGCIATHVAEKYGHLYDGVVAIGAALIAKDPQNPLEFQHTPEIPVLYLTNQSELSYIQNYIDNTKALIAELKTKPKETKKEENSSNKKSDENSSNDNSKKSNVKEIDPDHIVVPALWEVWREGHNHVSQEERLAALKSLEEWIKHKTFITVRKQNVLIEGAPKGKRPQFNKNGSCVVHV